MEPIICSCHQELTLSAIATCLQCRSQVFTTLELKAQQRALDKQAHQLMVESSKITTELYLRSFRQSHVQCISKENFYYQVRKAPRGEKVGKGSMTRDEITAEAKRLLKLV